MKSQRKPILSIASVILGLCTLLLILLPAFAQDQKDDGDTDRASFASRKDIRHLPKPLKDRLVELARRPHSFLPVTAFSEADTPSQLFQYYLLDTTGFEPNVFTTIVPGINDGTKPTATGPNGQLPIIGSVRVVLEPKPGLPTDPNDVRAAIDVFTDISGLFVINNESGWYEGWMIHDLRVPPIAPARPNGHARYGTITAEDAAAIRILGTHNNVEGNFFTVDGNVPHLPSATDHFPDRQTNLIAFPVSIGTLTRNTRATSMHTGSLILALIGFSHTTNCLLQEASPEPSKPVRLEVCSRSSLAQDHQEYAIIACSTEITRAIRVTQTELRSATFLIYILDLAGTAVIPDNRFENTSDDVRAFN